MDLVCYLFYIGIVTGTLFMESEGAPSEENGLEGDADPDKSNATNRINPGAFGQNWNWNAMSPGFQQPGYGTIPQGGCICPPGSVTGQIPNPYNTGQVPNPYNPPTQMGPYFGYPGYPPYPQYPLNNPQGSIPFGNWFPSNMIPQGSNVVTSRTENEKETTEIEP